MTKKHALNVLKLCSDHFHRWILRDDELSQKIAARYMLRAEFLGRILGVK